MTVSASIFKAYDIRGIVDKTLTDEAVRLIGQALATEGLAKGVKQMVVGRDGRLSGPRFADELAKGIQAAGITRPMSLILGLAWQLQEVIIRQNTTG
jgi:phosphomannomutase / phosphoglucomutase